MRITRQCTLISLSTIVSQNRLRDKSFITSWGGRLYSEWGGVRNFFLVMYGVGGGENKMTYGQGGGGHVFHQVLGMSDVFHWSFFSLKVIASRHPISQLYNVRLSEPLGRH